VNKTINHQQFHCSVATKELKEYYDDDRFFEFGVRFGGKGNFTFISSCPDPDSEPMEFRAGTPESRTKNWQICRKLDECVNQIANFSESICDNDRYSISGPLDSESVLKYITTDPSNIKGFILEYAMAPWRGLNNGSKPEAEYVPVLLHWTPTEPTMIPTSAPTPGPTTYPSDTPSTDPTSSPTWAPSYNFSEYEKCVEDETNKNLTLEIYRDGERMGITICGPDDKWFGYGFGKSVIDGM